MLKLTQEELNARIVEHEKWLCNHKEGEKLRINPLELEDVSRLDFSNRNLSYAKLSGLGLFCANFENTTLSHVDFRKSDLSHSNFRHAHLNKSDLTGANLKYTDFVTANILKQISPNPILVTQILRQLF